MADRFSRQTTLLDSIISDGFPCSADDANTFSQATRAIYVGSTGDVEVEMLTYEGANTILMFKSVPTGAILPIRAVRLTGNTTATDVIGLF